MQVNRLAEGRDSEVHRLRQGLWQCAAEAGIDTNGDTTYHGCGDIVEFAVNAVRELRHDYEQALDELRPG